MGWRGERGVVVGVLQAYVHGVTRMCHVRTLAFTDIHTHSCMHIHTHSYTVYPHPFTPHSHFIDISYLLQVRHFACLSWPDHGVPLTTAELLGFRHAVKRAATNPDHPIVIHCSAGVGRTGTYIAIDSLVEQCMVCV